MKKTFSIKFHKQWQNFWKKYWQQMKQDRTTRLEWALKLDQASIHADGSLCYVDNNCKLCKNFS